MFCVKLELEDTILFCFRLLNFLCVNFVFWYLQKMAGRRRKSRTVLVILTTVASMQFVLLFFIMHGKLEPLLANEKGIRHKIQEKDTYTLEINKDRNIQKKLKYLSKVRNDRNRQIYTLKIPKGRYMHEKVIYPWEIPKNQRRKEDKTNIKYPPYKIYIYELPEVFNKVVYNCTAAYHAGYQGFGRHISSNNIISYRNSWQFSLEIIIHNNLLQSPYRTFNISEASVFYLPFYSALSCFCEKKRWSPYSNLISKLHDDFVKYVQKLEHFKKGKPHVMALGKIEKEHAQIGFCRLLKFPITKNITFIGIEQDPYPKFRSKEIASQRPLIVAPYPSFGHLKPSAKTVDIQKMHQDFKRDIFILFGGSGMRYSDSDIRTKILSGPVINNILTKLSYDTYFKKAKKENLSYVNLDLMNDKRAIHLISWFEHSMFCLQPAGDSPTRKSFYDAIMCGCIPVIFNYENKVKYPFEDKIDYNKLTVKINASDVKNSLSVYNVLRKIDKEAIKVKQNYMYKIMNYLQYSYPVVNGTKHNDAIQYILDEIGTTLKIK